MKKLLLLAIMLCGISQAWADNWTDSEGTTWNYTLSGTEATITGCSQTTGDLTIPGTVNGYTVTSIGSFAFAWSSLTSLTIPESVTSIGWGMFYTCYSLTDVTIPEGATVIPSYMFASCTNLTNVTLPSTLTYIANVAFSGCSSLTSVNIPEGVTSIGEDAFYRCSSLTSVNIPKGVTSIGSWAFNWCDDLTSVYCYVKDPLDISYSTFGSHRSDITLYVPYGCKAAYEAAEYWQDFKEIIEMDPTEIDITMANNPCTFASAFDLDFTDVKGIKAYIASGFDPNAGILVLTPVKKVPAGTGLYLKGATGDYTIPVEKTGMYYSNLLIGVTEDTTLDPTTGSSTNFILGNGPLGIAFYTLSATGTITAGKSYLQLPTAVVTNAANGITLLFDDEETTGIDGIIAGISPEAGSKGYYTLDGRRLDDGRVGGRWRQRWEWMGRQER